LAVQLIVYNLLSSIIIIIIIVIIANLQSLLYAIAKESRHMHSFIIAGCRSDDNFAQPANCEADQQQFFERRNK
jgi:predicted branched-subunit amino acid permease